METVWIQAISFFKTRWYLFVGCVIVCLLVLFSYKWFTTSIFRVTTVITVNSNAYSKQRIAAVGNLLKSRLTAGTKDSPDAMQPIADKKGELKVSIITPNPRVVKTQVAAVKIESNKLELIGKTAALIDSITILKDQLLLLQNRANQIKLKINETKVVKLYNPQANQYQKHVQIYNYILSYLNKPVNNFVIIPEGFNPLEASIVNYINDFNKLQYKRQDLLVPNQPNLLLLKHLNQELQTIRQQLYAKIETEENTITAYLKAGEVNNTQIIRPDEELLANRRVLEGIIQRQQFVLQRIKVLNRQARKDSVYNSQNPLIKGVNLTVTPAITTSTDEIILIITVGLLIPFFVFFIRKYLTNPSQVLSVKQIIKLPTFVELNKNDRPDTTGFSTGLKEVVDKLLNNQSSPNRQVITITYVTTDVGTSQFCLNLARAFAETRKKVVLVDCNLQEPDLLEQLKIYYAKGLRSYFDETTKNYQHSGLIHYAASIPGVALIGAGPNDKKKPDDILGFMEVLTETPDDTEMHTKVDAEKWDILISGLKTTFDFVILQLPDLNLLAKSVICYPDGDENLYLIANDSSLIIKHAKKATV